MSAEAVQPYDWFATVVALCCPMIEQLQAGIDSRETADESERLNYGKEVNSKLGKARDRLDMLLLEAQGRPIPGFKKVSDLHHALLLRNYMVCLGQPEDVAEAASSKKLGSGDGGNK